MVFCTLLSVSTCILLSLRIVEPACVSQVSLGLEEKSDITDKQISSHGDIYKDHNATEVRLIGGKGWCVLNRSQPHLTVDFNSMVTISKISTQGVDDNGTSMFAPSYRIQFSYEGNVWYDYKAKTGETELNGNTDSSTIVNTTIHETSAQFMKIFPSGQQVTCIKMAVYGCKSFVKPIVEVKPTLLTVKNDGSGKVQCIVMGQLGLNAKWNINSGDTMAMDSFYSNSTNGIFYNETRLLKIKKPRPYGKLCSLNKEEAVIVCKKSYTCRAEYTFDNDTSVEKNSIVSFKEGVSVSVVVYEGNLSHLYIKATKAKIVSCSARSQDPVKIEWYNLQHPDWARRVSISKNESQGHLDFFQEALLTINLSVSDIMAKLNCTKTGMQKNSVECPSRFHCKAYYGWNSSINDEKEIASYFLVELPGQPDGLQAECTSKECKISWSQTQSGDLPESSIGYLIRVKNSSIEIKEKAVKKSSFEVKSLLPNHQYTVTIQAQVKDGGGNLWTSGIAKETFRTLPLKPKSEVVIDKPEATNDSLLFKWQPHVLSQDYGKLEKYDFELQEIKYGNSPLNGDMFWPGSVNSTTTMYRFTGLKPWRTYLFTIAAIYTHSQKSTDAKIEAETKEYVPSEPPTSIGGFAKTTEVILRWKYPTIDSWNGHIVGFHIKWKKVKRSARTVRDAAGYQDREESTIIFNCVHKGMTCEARFSQLEPYHKYVFKIAAKTKVGSGPFSIEKDFLTLQTGPSPPLSPSYNKSSPTFYLMWKEPLRPNGVLTGYEIQMKVNAKFKSDFSQTTYYDTRLSSMRTLKFRVRGYTEHLHSKGGHAGAWTEWVVAERLIKAEKHPIQEKTDKTALAIGLSFAFVIFVLIIAIIMVFFLYRRKERGGSRKKLEVEMDSLVEGDNGGDVSEEKMPLTRNLRNNGTYDVVPAETHRPVPNQEFQVYVNYLRDNEDELMTQQFKELMSGKCYSAEVSDKPENKPKNRYVNVPAYDHSRVILRPEGGKRIIHHRESDYVNANHVEGYCPQSTTKYIASQGPMEMVFPDFWRMIWQENVGVIIMLTNLEEGGKIKCDQYWPSQGACKYGHVTVRFNRVDQTADYLIRTFDIEKGSGKDKIKRQLIQFHFVSWPDYGVPEFPTAILSLRKRVRHYYNGEAPILVHCSAGVGRTGCFIVIDAMLERIDEGEGSVDIFNYLQYLRTRRLNMVQTLDQYIFAHLSIREYLTFGDTELSATDFERKFKDLQKDNGLEKEFKLIESTSPDLSLIDNSCKVLLRNGKFIDVFYIDGYKQRDAFLLCNSPSANMTSDFWKMLIEQNCHTVVMLNRLEEEDQHKYWPDMNTHYNYEYYSVVMMSEQVNGNIVTRKFKITSSESPGEHFELQHFQFLDWPSRDTPTSKDSILTLMSLIEKSRQNYGSGPVLVHSGNGAGRSGTLIAVYNSTERLKVEQLIDVPQCVRAIRTVVPIAIEVTSQYEFIYEMIRRYLEAFETYSNFSDPTMSMDDSVYS